MIGKRTPSSCRGCAAAAACPRRRSSTSDRPLRAVRLLPHRAGAPDAVRRPVRLHNSPRCLTRTSGREMKIFTNSLTYLNPKDAWMGLRRDTILRTAGLCPF